MAIPWNRYADSSHTFLYVVANYREQVGKIKFISIMRTLRLIGTTLLMVVLCLNFVACSDDDEKDNPSPYPTAEELVGTVWGGTNADKDVYEIKLTNKTDLTLNITSEEGEKYVDNATLKYEYNAENGKFSSSYEGMTIAGEITHKAMTFTIEGEKITLNKK